MNRPESESPELLAPAGDWECLRAAIENGANAVYFGLDHGFNARARAHNFRMDELPDLMQRLHGHGLRGYVTLNTLVFSEELEPLIETVKAIGDAGVDAVLVQDLGVARLIRQLCPTLELHASTQMTLTSAETIEAARSLGLDRVVLARELSVDEIREIRKQTTLPLEAFVHGALCVAYSGQCLTSESLGGRSANRGQCAQACRLPYDLICDGEDVPLDRVKYLLSPQDLAAYDLIPEMLAAGVTSFKIEGRLKTPEYVANITQHYRQALDAAQAGRVCQFSKDDVHEMEMSFSRGFSHGWLEGCDHKALVPGTSSAKRGVRVGTVQGIRGERVRVDSRVPLAAGDGLLFAARQERDDEQGGRIFHLWQNGKPAQQGTRPGLVELSFDRQRLDLSHLFVGQEVWKTDDPQLMKRLRKTFTAPDAQRRLPIDLVVAARAGEPLRLQVRTDTGVEISVESHEPLQLARKHVLTSEVLEQQLGRLGATSFALRHLEVTIEGEPMLPLSQLGVLRRELIESLTTALREHHRHEVKAVDWRSLLTATAPGESDASSPPRLHVLCRHFHQLELLDSSAVADIYVDFHDPRQYRDAVQWAQQHDRRVWLAPTRIQKPKELGLVRKIASYGGIGLLARNLATVAYCRDQAIPFLADFSLNATNPLTVDWLVSQGAQRVTASYDLNRDQLLGLIGEREPRGLEVVIHQHMPMFHMEHCVFCSLLSPGTNKTNCGRPCDRHVVKLRDRIGREHPLHADIACRNTLYNATPQSGAEAVHELKQRGVRHFRLELLEQRGDEVGNIVQLYHRLLIGEIPGREVWQQLKASNRVGVTRGTLEEARNPLAIL